MRAERTKGEKKMKKICAISAMLLITFSTLATFSLTVNAQNSPEQLTTSPHHDDSPNWSPDGERIVYRAFDSSGSYRYIWIMNKDGTGKHQLTSGDIVDGTPSFTPDGSKILFSRWGLRGDYDDIMIMNIDGTGVTRLTYGPDGKMCSGPVMSPDGTKIAFTLVYGPSAGAYDFWIALMNTGTIVYGMDDIEILTRGASPAWVNNGNEIIYSLYDENDNKYGDGRIMVMNKDGTNIRQLTNGPFDGHPSMSADGNRIVFHRASNPQLTDGELYTKEKDEDSVERLTFDPMNLQSSFSPQNADGTYEIVYASNNSGNWDIWKMEAPSSECTLSLEPNTGFASTTVVGSGFSSNSRMTITWDDMEIPPVPNPLITNSDGDFIAIISVPTQNDVGSHIVKATDESGNSANATFTVVEMTVSQRENRELSLLVDAFTIAVSIIAISLATIALLKKKNHTQ